LFSRALKRFCITLLVFAQPVVAECSVGAHALYWTPMACPYTYAQTSVQVFPPSFTTLRGRALIVPCEGDWGFRLFGEYLNDCLFARVSYQRFDAKSSSSVVADSLNIRGGNTIAGLSRATGQVEVDYRNVDVRMGMHLLQRGVCTLYLYGNARWIDLSHCRGVTQASLTTGVVQSLREESRLHGGAIGLGAGGEFGVGCGLGAFVDGNILGVISNRSMKNVEFRLSTPGAAPQVRQELYPSDTCVVPELDFRIGINHTYMCGCWKFVTEVGYEVDYFWHGSLFPKFLSGTILEGFTTFTPVCEDIGFAGLFFGGHLVF